MAKVKIAFLVPIYPPHFAYAENLVRTWRKSKLYKQSDLWFVFTTDDEKNAFFNWKNSIILPEKLRIFEHKGIINIKKLYGLLQIKDRYDYVFAIDAETHFTRNVQLYDICETMFKNKKLYGNLIFEEGRELTEKVKNSSKQHFEQYEESAKLESDFYLWFNQPCIYKTSNLDDFFKKIDCENKIDSLKWEDFDYYMYMYYLILFQGFKIEDIEIESPYGAYEVAPEKLIFRSEKYKMLNIYMCAHASLETFDNPKLFMLIHLDRGNIICKQHISPLRRFFSNFAPTKKLRKKLRGQC